MSLNFNFNNFKCSEKNVEFIFDNILEQYQSDFVEKNILKFFDNHFLNYISIRKQRDLILINYFYQLVLKDAKIDKKHLQEKKLSEFFDIKNGKITTSDGFMSIFNMKEIVNELNNEMSLLKTMHLFFNDNKKNFKEQILSIDIKIKKIINLNDKNIISRITKDEELRNNIIKHFDSVKNYEDVKINLGFYNSLKQMLKNKELLCK